MRRLVAEAEACDPGPLGAAHTHPLEHDHDDDDHAVDPLEETADVLPWPAPAR